MKKKNLLIVISIVMLTICIIPNSVFAKEEKPELKWEQTDIKPDTSYRGLEILCDANDGYITINNLGEIAKYNYNGEKVKTIINEFNINIDEAVVDGDSLLIYADADNVLYKFSLNGELVFEKQFEGMYEFDIYDNGYFVITYNYVSGSYQIIKLDKEGNTISTYEINDMDGYMIDSNNNQIIIIQKNEKSYLMTMDLNFNIINEREIKSQDIIRYVDEFIEVEDGYLLTINKELIKIDKEGNVILTNNKYEYNDIGVVSDGYIVVGSEGYAYSRKPILIKFDKNDNMIYEEEYPSEYEGYDYYYFDKIITLSNDDYIIYCKIGNSVYQPYFGSIILKYGYKDYKITPNIKGEGTIESSINTAKEGDKVTFNATPKDGYELKSIKVVTVSGKEIEVTDNSFIMPDEDVIIEGEFVRTLIENPKTGNIIMIIIGIGVILILGTITTIYYKTKKDRT